jgi:hypothetical protein
LYVPLLPGEVVPERGTRVLLFDDMGRGSTDDTYTWNEYGRPSIYTAMSIGEELEHTAYDAIYLGGDISYATGYMAVWDFYLDQISNFASKSIFLTTVGNHESDCPNSASYYAGASYDGRMGDSGGECGVASTTLIPMPTPATTDEPWWSYDVGLIHFVGMSTEHDYTIGSKQYIWLENDLASVNRTEIPWIIFGGHRAMYINSNYGGDVTSDIVVMDNLIENIEPLLWLNRVNLAFWGHNHAVQRQAAVLNKTVIQHSETRQSEAGDEIAWHENPQATVHMVVGTAGAKFSVNYVDPYPDWCEQVFYRYGYARVIAYNASYLDWQWVDSEDHIVYDKMVITQDDPTKPFVLPTDDDVPPPVDDNTGDDEDDTTTDTTSDSSKSNGWGSLSTVEQGFSITAVIVVIIGVVILGVWSYKTKYSSDKKQPLLHKQPSNLDAV